jgi:pilus assembly protein CpaC
MYATLIQPRGRAQWFLARLTAFSLSATVAFAPSIAAAQQPTSVVRDISRSNERLEMTVNTSQIITLGTRIPRLLVNNPELVTAKPLSETEVQIAALKPGVTQINFWDEKGKIYTVDLLIFGDVRELEVNLKRMFPASSIRVIRLSNSLVLEGQVDRPEIVTTVFRLAEDYAPKVVDNLTVGGAQQVVLRVKVMEVNRTKARNAGFDFAQISGSGGFFSSTASGILQGDGSIGTRAGLGTVQFGIVDGNNKFFGFIDWLEQNNCVKTLADPVLTTVSGRPANFNAGGEIFFQINNGISGSTVQSETFGTQVDFLPIVLGNGRIRLEVRPKISDIDNSKPLGNELFRTKVSQVDTGVEMYAGQTLALAGLIQTKVNSQTRGIPYLKDLPYAGAAFRHTSEKVEETELLIMVTPEFGEAMDPHEVPPCGPGMETMSPSNCELYWKGMIEVPACGPCGASDPCACTAPGLGCQAGQCGPYCSGYNGPYGGAPYGSPAMATDGGMMPPGAIPLPAEMPYVPTPADSAIPVQPGPGVQEVTPLPHVPPQAAPADPAASTRQPQWQPAVPQLAVSQPAMRHNPYVPTAEPTLAPPQTTSTPGLIGPIGYDVQK